MKERHWLLFPLVFVAYETTCYLANDMYLPALPSIALDLQADQHLAQLTLTWWFVGTATFQLLLGPLADRYGRRSVLFGGGLLFITSLWVCVFTNNIYVMIVARFFQGVGVCSMLLAGYATIHELFDERHAIRAMSIMTSVSIFAPSVGPLIGAFILMVGSWRDIFVLLALLSMLILIVLFKVMPETNLQPQSFHLKRIYNSYKRVLKNSRFMLYTLSFSLSVGALLGWLAAGPFLVIEDYHYSPVMFGFFQLLIFGSFGIAVYVVNQVLKKGNVLTLINYGLIFAILASILSIIAVAFFRTQFWIMVGALTLFAAADGLSFASLQRKAVESCQEPMGARMSLFTFIVNVFGALGTILVSVNHGNEIYVLTAMISISTMMLGGVRYYLAQKSL